MNEKKLTAEGSNGLPRHIAIIMDGNGRWAKSRGQVRTAGHVAGVSAFRRIANYCKDIGVEYLTVYAFSTENWKRSQEEVGGIFNLLIKFAASELEELNANNVKVHILGDYSKLPKAAVSSIEKALETTKDNDGLQFNIALNYGSRAEIARAVRSICAELSAGGINAADIDEAMISRYLYTGRENGDIPDPDLIIRTSGEQRLSNFLLWQAAYSELAFTASLWPDFTADEFEEMISEFCSRSRRFGGR